MMYGEGISKEGDLIDLAVNHNLVEKSGSWFSYKGERIGQGRENAKQFLRENRDILAKIDTAVRVAIGLTPPQVEVPPPASPAEKATASAAVARGTESRAPARR
jgi:recombination protein RecA